MTQTTRKLAILGGFSALFAFLLLVFGGFSSSPASRDSRVLAEPSPALSFDPNVLLKQFEQAQSREMKGLLKHEQATTKRLLASQASQQKQFDRRERDARRRFFSADRPGAEKRAYMKDLIARREALRKEFARERAQAKQESDDRIRALQEQQQEKLGRFKAAIGRNQRPDESLWPQPTLETD